MPIPIFSYDRYDRLKTDTDISINTDADTDMVLADTDMIKTDTDISVSVSAKNIDQQIYRSISIKVISTLITSWSQLKGLDQGRIFYIICGYPSGKSLPFLLNLLQEVVKETGST